MPLSKSGSYHANPATAGMHDQSAPIPDPGMQDTGSAQAVEIHSPSHPETGDGQNFHVRVHRADGQMEDTKHPSYDEAAQHGAGALEQNEAEPSNDAGEAEDDNDSDDEY